MAEDAVSANVQSALIDAGLWLYHGFFVPGDYVCSILSTHAPRVGQFLGLRAVGHGSVLSGIISGVVWLGAIALIVAACKVVHKLDRALTACIVRLYEGVLRTGRIVARRLAIAYRSRALRRQARLARTEVAGQAELTALELAVLRCHVKLAPGHLLTASGIASDLDVSSTHVERALTRLTALSLVHRTFGAGDGEDGYRLTRPGVLFLAACGQAHLTKGQEAPKTKYKRRVAAVLH
jgi:DNA-binding MarR family transcriptional regulator